MSEERDKAAKQYWAKINSDKIIVYPRQRWLETDFKAGYDAGVDSAQGKLKEHYLEIENLKMTCRRLAAAKSLETRDKVAEMCKHLFADNGLRRGL